MGMFRYAMTEQRGLSSYPLNKVDLLILCWLAFFDYRNEDIVLPMRLGDIASVPEFANSDRPFIPSFHPAKSRRLMEFIRYSLRFKDIVLIDYMAETNTYEDVQFSACAYQVRDKVVVAFSGTDTSYVGWKEDFSLSYKDDIVSYKYARTFLQRVLAFTEGDVIVVGYSKGGNVASNTVMTNDDPRIKRVYSFDGPGFREEVLNERISPTAMEKIEKFIPQSSLVGVLFNSEKEARFIRATMPPIVQHDPFSWAVKNGDFVYLKKRSISSSYLDRAFNGWVKSLTPEEREKFTEIAFGALNDLKAPDLLAFSKTFLLQTGPLMKAYSSLSKKDRKFFNSVVSRLVKNFLRPKKG